MLKHAVLGAELMTEMRRTLKVGDVVRAEGTSQVPVTGAEMHGVYALRRGHLSDSPRNPNAHAPQAPNSTGCAVLLASRVDTVQSWREKHGENVHFTPRVRLHAPAQGCPPPFSTSAARPLLRQRLAAAAAAAHRPQTHVHGNRCTAAIACFCPPPPPLPPPQVCRRSKYGAPAVCRRTLFPEVLAVCPSCGRRRTTPPLPSAAAPAATSATSATLSALSATGTGRQACQPHQQHRCQPHPPSAVRRRNHCAVHFLDGNPAPLPPM